MKNILIKNEGGVLIISLLVSILSAYCAIMGFIDKNLYGNIISTGVFKMVYMAGTISQDIITIFSSITLIILVIFYMKTKDIRIFISIIGLLSFYFYAYGTYVISALYTSIYIIYMFIFSLSIFGMVLGINGFEKETVHRLQMSKWVRISSIIFLSFTVCTFVPMWISHMIPHTKSHTIPDFYAIYILDLCIVMPFFIYVIFMLIKNTKSAYILLGVSLVKTITLILSVVIGEITVSAQYFLVDVTMVIIYGFIISISSVLYVFYCLRLKKAFE